ncbi:hypothetical protein B0H19DRAFT_491419 [Mycena capillaripes]|nr:hypothetical protein B0H19DRAFT_491419 [Mycena capillaripes]
MALLQPQLVLLPVELLLLIVDSLCEANSIPSIGFGEEQKPISHSTHLLHSLSLVCRQLRRLCLSRLFSRMKITHTEPLRLLQAKCVVDAEFAGLIRQLDLAHVDSPEEREEKKLYGYDPEKKKNLYRYGPDILPALLPCLKSLEWLDLHAKQIDAGLLEVLNSHSSLATVAVSDMRLEALKTLSSTTSQSLSKIRVHSALLNICLKLQTPALHLLMSRRPRLAHLILRDNPNIGVGPGTLLLPGLERLEIGVYLPPISPMSWLPDFVNRHTSLKVIKFSRRGRRNADILFESQFHDAMERESLSGAVDLIAFSISRTSSATSLDEWQVVHLDIEITKGVGVSALRFAHSLTPQLSSLDVRMARWGKEPVHIGDLVSSICLFPSLRRLELHWVYKHLIYEGPAPWPLPPSNPKHGTSGCIAAHSALRWITACVAQYALLLNLVHITDEGYELLKGTSNGHPWKLEVTYQVQRNGDLRILGTPKLVAAPRFRLCEERRDAATSSFIYGGGQTPPSVLNTR